MNVGPWNVSIFRLLGILALFVFAAIQGGVLPALGAFGALLLFWAVSLWPRWFHENAFYLAIVTYLGVFFGLAESEAKMGFYTAAAQIIPILFLAMAVGSQLSLTGRAEPDRRVRIVLIYAFGLGEWHCLDALASGEPRDSAFAFVAAALIAAGVVIVAEVVGREDDEPQKM